MKKLVLSLILVTGLGFAQEAKFQFDEANQLYRKGEYAKAAGMYEQVLKNGYENASIYYNLGNAYFKLGNVAASILNYERAKRLSPEDEDINYNLRLANLKVVDKIEPIPSLFFINWWNSVMNLYSADRWGAAVVIFIWITALAGSMIFMARKTLFQRLFFFLVLASLLLCALSLSGMMVRASAERNQKAGIVFSQTVPVKSAPDAQSVDLFILHEGVKVEFLDQVGSWRKIKLADGKVGWILQEAVQVI